MLHSNGIMPAQLQEGTVLPALIGDFLEQSVLKNSVRSFKKVNRALYAIPEMCGDIETRWEMIE
jgi:hypothetical protein